MLSFKGYLKEARRNPEMNPKVSVNQRIKNHVIAASDIRGSNTRNSFVSFTQIEKLGINPNSRYNTPLGIYSYPSLYVVSKIIDNSPTTELPFAGNQPYVNLFSVRGNIVDVSKMDDNDLSYYYQQLSKVYTRAMGIRDKTAEWKEAVDYLEDEVFDAASTYSMFSSVPGGRFWWVTKTIADILVDENARDWKPSLKTSSWNRVFREIGIDGCIDSEGMGIIHTSEPVQAVFFTNRGFYDVEQYENKFNYTDYEKKERIRKGKGIKATKEYYRSLDDKNLKLEIMKDPKVIRYLKNPPDEIQLYVTQQHGGYIQYIKNPSEKVQLAAVQEDGNAIKFIEDPSEEVQLAAVRNSWTAIRFIQSPSEEVQLAAVRDDWVAIKRIKNPTEKVQQLAAEMEAAES